MTMDWFDLSGRVALVTGASRGLGQAMAIGLAEAGADVIGLDREAAVGATGAAVEAAGRRFHALQVDLEPLDAAGFHDVVAQAVAVFGRLDILVNNAGIIRREPALTFSEESWQSVIQINLNAVFFLSQAAGQHMHQQGGGKIINIASMLSYQGGITVPSYTAAKHGVMGITRALANEWAQYHINVNAIAPGYMATDNTAPLRADAERSAAILERIPAGRWGQPDDLKGATVFLASAASDYLHGATINVDGGWLAR
jgi:2-deoxy-D-gluconate 3-dehydrogenase